MALAVNGILLFVGDGMRRRAGQVTLARLGWLAAFGIGLAQIVALIPGFSRSGATLVGSLLIGLSYEEAAHFSFLMATPIIAAAGVLEVPKLLRHGDASMLGTAAIGGLVAFVAAYASVWFLMRYFKQQEVRALRPFAAYCVAAGLVAVAMLTFAA